MIDTLHFLNSTVLVPAVIGATLLFLLFVWKEWISPIRYRFYLHVLIALVSIISLIMLLLKPALWSSVQTTAGVLLTEGYEEKRLDSLKEKNTHLNVIRYRSNNPIGQVLDSINPLFILGEGVRSFDFWQFENRPVNYLGAKLPLGTTRLNYKKKLFVGDRLRVRVEALRPITGHKLILADAGGNEMDSVLLEDTPKKDFELSAELKVSGSYLYTLREKDSLGKIVSNEPLPIQVFSKENLKVLMVNSFPTFESKYLKNFLAEAGHELIVRSQLTRGKYKFEYFNTQRRAFYSFDQKLMKSIDLMIIDANSYRSLSKKSLQIIQEAIKNNGLGLFILPDARFFQLPSKISNFEFSRGNSSKSYWNEWPKLSLEKYQYQFGEGIRLEELHRAEDVLLTAYIRKGKGRIGTTLIQNSYQLLLNGNMIAYKQFWSKTVSDLSKRKPSVAEWDSDMHFPIKDESFSFEIRTSVEEPQVMGVNGRIPLMQNPDIPELWYGNTYPRTTGWHTIGLQNDSTVIFNFYALDSTKWKSVKSFKTMMENKRQFNERTELPNHKKTLKSIDSLWFFLIFVLGMGYLWLAPKLVHD